MGRHRRRAISLSPFGDLSAYWPPWLPRPAVCASHHAHGWQAHRRRHRHPHPALALLSPAVVLFLQFDHPLARLLVNIEPHPKFVHPECGCGRGGRLRRRLWFALPTRRSLCGQQGTEMVTTSACIADGPRGPRRARDDGHGLSASQYPSPRPICQLNHRREGIYPPGSSRRIMTFFLLHYLAPGADRGSRVFFIYFWLPATRPNTSPLAYSVSTFVRRTPGLPAHKHNPSCLPQ